MKIYLDPIVEEKEDGTICTTLIRATPKNIDERIRNLSGFKKAQYDIEKILKIIRAANSDDEAEKILHDTFKLTRSQAHFMINTTIEEVAFYCNPKRLQVEINNRKALKMIVAEDIVDF